MAKVLKINRKELTVTVGEDGVLEDYNLEDFDFEPAVGDVVSVYRGQDKTIIIHEDFEEPVRGYQTMVYEGQPVNKVAYCVSSFLLGGIGVQKFISGKTAQGVASILFCWTLVPTIIGYIDFAKGLAQPSDEEGNIWVK